MITEQKIAIDLTLLLLLVALVWAHWQRKKNPGSD
jgi:hypothetical protein